MAIQTHSNSEKEYSQKTRAGRWDFESPCTMSFRILRFYISPNELETVATSLPPCFTSNNIRDLYHMRWGIETSFRHLKYALGLVNIHGKSDDFVLQEIYAQLTAFNFCSRISGHVEIPSKDTLYAHKVNFTQAVNLCRRYLKHLEVSSSALIKEISKNLTPIQPGRADKRKLRPKGFVGFTYRVPA